MKTCDKCGSNNLKYAGNDNASGVDKEMYQCQDCGQITFFLADEAESKSACLPSYNFGGGNMQIKTEEDIKETTATTSLEIYVTCPYCGDYQDRCQDLTEHLCDGELRTEECEAELKCKECGERFIVVAIEF